MCDIVRDCLGKVGVYGPNFRADLSVIEVDVVGVNELEGVITSCRPEI